MSIIRRGGSTVWIWRWGVHMYIIYIYNYICMYAHIDTCTRLMWSPPGSYLSSVGVHKTGNMTMIFGENLLGGRAGGNFSFWKLNAKWFFAAGMPSNHHSMRVESATNWASAIRQALMPVTPQSSTPTTAVDRTQRDISQLKLPIPG